MNFVCGISEQEQPAKVDIIREKVKTFLKGTRATFDKATRRVTVRCVCDSTYLFALQLAMNLWVLDCTDIQQDGHVDKEQAPPDKPWCSYVFEVSGIVAPGSLLEQVLEEE